MNAGFWVAVIRAAPALIALLRQLADRAAIKAAHGQGYDEAVAEGLDLAHKGLMAAIEAGNEADKRHQADPTDGAFDAEFKRQED